MGVTKKNIALSPEHVQLMEKTKKALGKISADLIKEAKVLDSYLVVSDTQGNVTKIPAKDL